MWEEHAQTTNFDVSFAKTTEPNTDGDAVWVMDSGGPKEACIRGVQIPMLRGSC